MLARLIEYHVPEHRACVVQTLEGESPPNYSYRFFDDGLAATHYMARQFANLSASAEDTTTATVRACVFDHPDSTDNFDFTVTWWDGKRTTFKFVNL